MRGHFLGAKDSAAHWGACLVREGHADPARSTQIGLRGHTRSFDWLEPSRELGYDVATMADFHEMGMEAACARVRARLGERPVSITFDIDSLDSIIAPAVSNPGPGVGGFSADEAMAGCARPRGAT
jgi:guanidinopropionase